MLDLMRKFNPSSSLSYVKRITNISSMRVKIDLSTNETKQLNETRLLFRYRWNKLFRFGRGG